MAEKQADIKRTQTGEPVLAREVAQVRAEHAFDTAVSRTALELVRSNRIPANEIADVKRMLSEALKSAGSGRTVDPANVLSQYVEENPSSKIAYLNGFMGGTPDWIISSSGNVGFNQAAFTADFKTYMSSTKNAVVAQLVAIASDPRNRSGNTSLAHLPNEGAAQIFTVQLAKMVSQPGAKEPLPLDIAYQNNSAVYISRTEPPEQSVGPEAFGKRRKDG